MAIAIVTVIYYIFVFHYKVKDCNKLNINHKSVCEYFCYVYQEKYYEKKHEIHTHTPYAYND